MAYRQRNGAIYVAYRHDNGGKRRLEVVILFGISMAAAAGGEENQSMA